MDLQSVIQILTGKKAPALVSEWWSSGVQEGTKFHKSQGLMTSDKRFFLKGDYAGPPVPAKRSIQDLVKKWRATGSVGNATKNRQPLIRTPALVADIQQILTVSPSKSTRKLAQQARISRTTCRRVLKDLRMKPYRVTGAHKLKESDKMKQRKMQEEAHSNMFCNG